MLCVFFHAHRRKAVVNDLSYLCGGNAEVFGRKSDVLLHNRCDDLVVGVLEHHRAFFAYFKFALLVGREHPVNGDSADARQQKPAEHLRKCRFAAAVVTEYGGVCTLFEFQRNVADNVRLSLAV